MLNSGMPEEKPDTSKEFEINLLDVAIILVRHKKLILIATLLTTVVALIINIREPDFYTADAKFLPPQSMSSTSAILGLDGLGLAMSGGAGRTGDIYVAMLKSRTMQERINNRFSRRGEYSSKSSATTEGEINAKMSVNVGKDGIYVIEVIDIDPKRAAMLADGYIEELKLLNDTVTASESFQKAKFLEAQVLRAKETLLAAQAKLNTIQVKDKSMQLQGYADQALEGYVLKSISEISQLKMQVKSKEIQLSVLSASTTSQNPEYIRLQQEIGALKQQIGISENNAVSAGRLSESQLDYVKRFRELKYSEAIYNQLVGQREMSKAVDTEAGSTIRIIDAAVVPKYKSGPYRIRNVMIASLCGVLLAMVLSFIIEAYNRAKKIPESNAKIQYLQNQLLHWR